MGCPSAGEDERRYKIKTVSQSREATQATAAIARLRLGHPTLSAHLHRLRLFPDHFCPWCRTTSETTEHFLLHCPRFHTHHTALRSRLSALAITTLHLPPFLRPLAFTPPGNLLSFTSLV
ncbi:hypothetical protein E2C01_065879 [Portunus trituberculatus]|uniref:Reverse transcriptase zinc-binding domain-containing protein n=1 Tax=Portunus trituberculatus TaxID=210409 RepID=A0A5B7HQU8_PORTR|nr:hypothetical protein [Portunus trituberculatus]